MKQLLLFVVCMLMVCHCFITPSYAGDGKGRARENADENAVASSFDYDEKTARLTMSFEEEDLKKSEPEKIRYFRKKKSFRVNEAFELPKELCEALGTKGPILIRCGDYPVEYKNGTFTIVLLCGT